MQELKVTRVSTNQDMRGVHKMRFKVRVAPGEAHLFLNRKGTIARLIDTTQSVHSYYAPKGDEFNMDLLKEMVAGLRLLLVTGKTQEKKIGSRIRIAA